MAGVTGGNRNPGGACKMKANEVTEQIIASAIEVHRALGPGLLESAYEACLVYELTQRGLYFQRQSALPVVYKNVRID
jgi:GxxExxY protein